MKRKINRYEVKMNRYRVSLIDYKNGGPGRVSVRSIIEAGSKGEAVCMFIEQRDSLIRELASRNDCSSYAFRVVEVVE